MMAAIRIYISGGDDGWFAWLLDLCGCVAIAPTEDEALDKVPRAVAEYGAFVRAYGGEPSLEGAPGTDEVEVVERIVSVDESLFEADREEASAGEIQRAIDLLGGSRAELESALASVPEAAFDWDPPYRAYPSWARWRTIREVLAHVAICETRYYLRGIGHDPGPDPPGAGSLEPGSRAWYAALGRSFWPLLVRTRAETVAFLREVLRSTDRRRIREEPGYSWSVRKALRRLVWHERAHTKNIRRIARDFSRAAR